MHMSDALISPVVGAVMWAGAAGAAAYSVRKISREDLIEGKKVPLMGVMGAFVFAAQMLNFTIPGTGSSGHIAGGLLLASMLGPEAAFLTMIAILGIQSLFFADGGLLALGSNIINMGFYSCFLAYPLIFKPLAARRATPGRIIGASVLASVVGLQLGAFSVVLETLLSGKTELPFGTFVLLMQPIHLAIGAVEGLITAAVLVFLNRVEPQSVAALQPQAAAAGGFPKRAIAAVAILAVLCGGVLSWFASTHPDGLEWSIQNVTGATELQAPDGVHAALADVQGKTAFMPDYAPKAADDASAGEESANWPAVNSGTSAAGIVGSAITLALAGVVGLLLYLPKRRKKQSV